MSWWRSALGTVGDVAKFALPAAAFIPGVNIGVAGLAGLGAAAGAAGRLNDKRKDGSGRYEAITLGNLAPAAAKGGITSGVGAYLGGAGAAANAGRLGATPGMVGLPSRLAGASSQGDALQRLLRGGGQAVDWLTDKDQGASRTALMTSLLSTGTGIMGGRAQGAVEDETMRFNRERTLAEEARKQKVLDLLMSRFGGDIR